MTEYMQRVVAESDALASKIVALEEFMVGSVFLTIPHEERTRLNTQLGYMQGYLAILNERITAFNQG